ncbi:unnamed protein product [Mytilus coruscus]|uniref:Uncharacterized protein n=1 Tax=Mytilus coruscus TaxID=42192 RepID=A0A6J8EV82_MYTCO|nr:unnamed protein product [Mytilus coruscus]
METKLLDIMTSNSNGRFGGKKHETESFSNRSCIESDSSSLPSLNIIAVPIYVCKMEKSNSDDDFVEKNPQPVINISSNTDLSDDSNDSLTIREEEDVQTVEQLTKQINVQGALCGRKRCSFFTNVHGNTKTANTPYVLTSKRVLADNSVEKRAKETFDVIFADAGGMMHASSPLELPRNTKQINNVKQTQKGAVAVKEKDSMFSADKSMQGPTITSDPYIRLVQCAPEFCCICSSDLVTYGNGYVSYESSEVQLWE